jgi:hypothetical protein|tara:strand:+ start:32 stop:436 length:405 start_codon:yes stop_codon:yes gene_type:complete
MTDITALREAIATNLATISGLRTDSEVPDSPNPPVAIVELESIDYDGAMQQGLTTLTFKIIVIVSRQSDRVSQRSLNDYASQNGARSIKIAVESDRSLNGNAMDCRVQGLTSVGSLELNNTEYSAIEFSVAVYV